MEWHARYHRDALDGMRALTLEERGAYQTILDLIYDYGRPISDDPRWLAGWLGVSVRKWSALRAALIQKGKIAVSDGVISNSRALSEIEKAVKRQRVLSESGVRGGNKSAETRASLLKTKGPEASHPSSEPASEQVATLKLKTDTVQDSSSSPLRARVAHDVGLWKQRLADATEMAGAALNTADPASKTYTVLRNLCEPAAGEPCDWQADVVPAIEVCSARKIAARDNFGGWTYISKAALANRDRRLAGLPAPQSITDQPRRAGKADTGAVIDRVFGAAS